MIPGLITSPTSGNAVLYSLRTAAAAWNEVVYGCLIRGVIVAVERRAAAPVAFLVSGKPQAHTSPDLVLHRHSHYGVHISVMGAIRRNAQPLGLGGWAECFAVWTLRAFVD
jgi:hypothetical protein